MMNADIFDLSYNGVTEALASMSSRDTPRVRALMSTPATQLKGISPSGRRGVHRRVQTAIDHLEEVFGEALDAHQLAVEGELDEDAGQTILLSVVDLGGLEIPAMTLKVMSGSVHKHRQSGSRDLRSWMGCDQRIQWRTPGGSWSEPSDVAAATNAIVARCRPSHHRADAS